jgi:hypothetical protein
MVILVGRAKNYPESFGPVELSKDCVDSGDFNCNLYKFGKILLCSTLCWR